ncbi:MAG: SymE family type I addiction module toxin [Sediminibacterium magnilacihabitans]|jgi:toxic protein SymE|nr:SymE family type I addiction module toxin [Sediminibacterium magnilacihabitans]
MAMKTIRKAKLHYKHRVTGGDWSRPGRCQTIPWLNVCGLWLEQAGFKVGDPVEIRVEENMLTIKNCAVDGHSNH